MIQAARSNSAMGTFRSSIMLGNAVTTTVWSKAVMKAPRPTTVRTNGVGSVRSLTSINLRITRKGCRKDRWEN